MVEINNRGEVKILAGANIHRVVQDAITLLKQRNQDHLTFKFNNIELTVSSESYPTDIVEIYFLKCRLIRLGEEV